MTDESDKAPEPSKPKRRWYQYSLRSLLVVITILCVWLGYISNEARKQRNAVAWVKEKGGNVKYDYQFDKNGFEIQNAEIPSPDWLREWIGIDYFCDVTKVNLSGPLVSDISPLEDLRELEKLDLSLSEVSDLSSLEGMPNLKSLVLTGNPVTDLSPLADLTNLNYLQLDDTQVNDLTPLKDLTNLVWLYLPNTPVSNLSPLKGLTNLKTLVLRANKVSKEEVKKLRIALPNCWITWDGE